MERFCRNCGARLNLEAKFCRACGTKVEIINSMNHQVQTTPIRSVQNNKKQAQKRWVSILVIGVTIMMILVLVSIFFFQFKPWKSPTDGERLLIPKKKVVFTEKEVMAEALIEPDGSTLQSADGKISMTFDEFCIDKPTKAKIVRVELAEPSEDEILEIYDFRLTSDKQPNGVITLKIPYDPAQVPIGRAATDCVSGVYYNKELGEWIEESYQINEAENLVIIKTTHLSPHGTRISINNEQGQMLDLFITVNQGTPDEYVLALNPESVLGRLRQEEMLAFLEQLKAIDITGSKQAFNDTAIKILGDSGSFGSLGVESFKLTTYEQTWSKSLGNRLGELSGALVLAQLASDIYYQKPQVETYFNLLKGMTYWKGAAAAAYLTGPVGGTIATVVLAGIFLYEVIVEPISIPQYIADSNHQVIVDAYTIYYYSKENYRSKREWLKVINDIVEQISKQAKTEDDFDQQFKSRLDKAITAYATEFFNQKPSKIRSNVSKSFDVKQGYLGNYDRVYSATDKDRNERYVQEYVTEILSGVYEGVTTSLQDELINQLKQELYKKTLPDILKMRQEYQYLKQLDYFRQAQQKACQYLNTKISLLINDQACKQDETSKYAGFYIVPDIANPSSTYQLAKWIIKLNRSGQGQLDYTLLSHQLAGDFTRLCLYDKADYDKIIDGTAKPVTILDIGMIRSNRHTIELGKPRPEIAIAGPRNISYQADGIIEHQFEAASDYQAKCSIKWDFGDGSELIETNGNKSQVSHEYVTAGVFRITASLFDENKVLLAEDLITLEVKNKLSGTTYTGIIPFSQWDYEAEEDRYSVPDQAIVLIKKPNDRWQLTFDFSAEIVNNQPPAHFTETYSAQINIEFHMSYSGDVEVLFVKTGTYQGTDVSETGTKIFTIEVNHWNEETGELDFNFGGDLFDGTIIMTKSDS